jgi:hypothetical protein
MNARSVVVGSVIAAVLAARAPADPSTPPPTAGPQARSLQPSPAGGQTSPDVSVAPTASGPVGSSGAGLPQDFGASTPLFSDTFDDPASGWGTGSTPGGNVEYVDGALLVRASTAGHWVWSYRPLEAGQNIVRLEGTFTASGPGYQGLLCTNTEEQFHGAVLNADGRWVFITLTDAGAEVLTTGEEQAWTISPAAPLRMALDCAGTATGAFRMQLSLPEAGLAVHYEGGLDGPDAFDRVGLYGEALADDYTLRVDDVLAFGGDGRGP